MLYSNLVVSAPMNEKELRNLMFTAQLEKNQHPFVIVIPGAKAFA
jgi:1-deoxy-D-xylulose-5-phosphate synthase